MPSSLPSVDRRSCTDVLGVIAEAALVDRSAGEVELGVPFYPLVSINFPVYEADAVPPELAAIPAIKPGSRKQ